MLPIATKKRLVGSDQHLFFVFLKKSICFPATTMGWQHPLHSEEGSYPTGGGISEPKPPHLKVEEERVERAGLGRGRGAMGTLPATGSVRRRLARGELVPRAQPRTLPGLSPRAERQLVPQVRAFWMEITLLFLLVHLSQIILHSFLSHQVNLQNVFKSCHCLIRGGTSHVTCD